MTLTPAQQRAVEHARDALNANLAGALPPGIDPEQAGPAYWRGFLERTLTVLLDALDENGDAS